VVVDGRVIESAGKTENAQHVLALDHERQALGPDYQHGGWLFCWKNGKPPPPDTITCRSK
jgi:hypothetical protein